jgi:hypothetical protein
LTEIAKRFVNVFEVSMTPGEFASRYKDALAAVGVVEGSHEELAQQAVTALNLQPADIVTGQHKV